MNFAKIAFGALLIGIGAVLLAVPLGIAHPDTPFVLLRYWPVILIAFGLAFLASVVKNPFLGFLAVLLILGGAAYGIYWMKHQRAQGKGSPIEFVVDLRKTKPTSLSVRVRTFAGRFYIGGGQPDSKALRVRVRTSAGDSAAGYRFAVSGRDAAFEWPRKPGLLGLPPPGVGLDFRLPESLPLTLSWRGRLASIYADLTRLTPARCTLDGVASSILLGFKGAERPEEIRIKGFASMVKIRIHGDCPVRLITESPLIFRSLSSDFVPWGTGREKDRVYASAGRGRPVTIHVDGPFLWITIERVPLAMVSRGEDSEWQEAESTASRSRSRWSWSVGCCS